jgi:hypothetical protein
LLWWDSGGEEEFFQHHPLVQLIISNLIHTNTISAFVEKKSSCVAKLQCLISWSLLLGRVHRQLDCWSLVMMSQMLHLQFKRVSTP